MQRSKAETLVITVIMTADFWLWGNKWIVKEKLITSPDIKHNTQVNAG